MTIIHDDQSDDEHDDNDDDDDEHDDIDMCKVQNGQCATWGIPV